MYRYQLYNIQEVDELKQKLNYYKTMLESLKVGDIIEDYLQLNRAFNELKAKYSNLEGEMKMMEEYHQREIADYEKKESNFANQVEMLNNMVNELTKDVNRMVYKLEQIQFGELVEKVNNLLISQDQTLLEEKNEIEKLKEEISQLKKHMKSKETSQQPPAPRKSEYRRLQNMLQSSKHVEQSPNQKKNNIAINQRPMDPTTRGNTMRTSHLPPNFKPSVPPNVPQNQSNTINASNDRRKTFRHAQFDLNKNIITRVSTPKEPRVENSTRDFSKFNDLIIAKENKEEHSDDSVPKAETEKNNQAANQLESVSENETKGHDSEKSNKSTFETMSEPSATYKINMEEERESQEEIQNQQLEQTKGQEEFQNQHVEQSKMQEVNRNQQTEPSKKREFASFLSIFQRKE